MGFIGIPRGSACLGESDDEEDESSEEEEAITDDIVSSNGTSSSPTFMPLHCDSVTVTVNREQDAGSNGVVPPRPVTTVSGEMLRIIQLHEASEGIELRWFNILDRVSEHTAYGYIVNFYTIAFLAGTPYLSFAVLGFHVSFLPEIANVCTAAAQALVIPKEPYICALVNTVVFVTFLAERVFLAGPRPHALGLLLGGGSDVWESENSYMFLFERLNLWAAVVLASLGCWKERHLLRSSLITFLIILGGTPLGVHLIDIRWRQRVRLLMSSVRIGAAVKTGYSNRNMTHADELRESSLPEASLVTKFLLVACIVLLIDKIFI